MKTFLLVTFCCAMAMTQPAIAQRAPVKIPGFARVLGLPIGYATEEDFIKKLGRPLRTMGGHSNGRCTWYDPTNKLTISMDGFDYARGGLLVDDIEIERRDLEKGLPTIRRRLKLRDYRLFGGALWFGETRTEVIATIKRRGWKYTTDKGVLVLTAPGNVDFRGTCTSSTHVAYLWEARLTFDNEALAGVYLSVLYR